mgnify:CR=1 FL=1
MKTRNSNKQPETTKQGGGCCGSAPSQVKPVKSFCYGSTPEVVETSQVGGRCR